MLNITEGTKIKGIIKDLDGYDPAYVEIAGYKIGDEFVGYAKAIQDEQGLKWTIQEKPNGLFSIDLNKLSDVKLINHDQQDHKLIINFMEHKKWEELHHKNIRLEAKKEQLKEIQDLIEELLKKYSQNEHRKEG